MSLCASLACIRHEDGRILTIWHPVHKGWVLPGGKAKRNETLLQCLSRELAEEVGMTVVSAEILYTTRGTFNPEFEVTVFVGSFAGEP